MNILKNAFAPAYSLTAHKCEGMTINHKFNIYEFHKMDRKHKYTCLTRTTDYKNIILSF
jgi:hypothetical protein